MHESIVQAWQDIEFGTEHELLWETFHENSKTDRHGTFLSNKQALELLHQLSPSLNYETGEAIPLCDPVPDLHLPLSAALLARTTPRRMQRQPLTLAELTALLHYSYGVTRSNEDTPFPRPFRVIPSGGGLYPLEIFAALLTPTATWPAGLYHYNPSTHRLCLLRAGSPQPALTATLAQPEILDQAGLLLLATGVFRRSTLKYKDRGYRFTLLEAGHWAQNVNLVAQGLGLCAWNIGGYFDREVDRVLGIDGVNHSTLYLCAIGGKASDEYPA